MKVWWTREAWTTCSLKQILTGRRKEKAALSSPEAMAIQAATLRVRGCHSITTVSVMYTKQIVALESRLRDTPPTRNRAYKRTKMGNARFLPQILLHNDAIMRTTNLSQVNTSFRTSWYSSVSSSRLTRFQLNTKTIRSYNNSGSGVL